VRRRVGAALPSHARDHELDRPFNRTSVGDLRFRQLAFYRLRPDERGSHSSPRRREGQAASRSSRAATPLYEATRTTTRQPSRSGAMPCYAGLCGGRRGGDPSMACKGSGVQIRSAPPQVNGPLHRRPPANPGLRAADTQRPPVRGSPDPGHGVTARRVSAEATLSMGGGRDPVDTPTGRGGRRSRRRRRQRPPRPGRAAGSWLRGAAPGRCTPAPHQPCPAR
jgi:hypothetical protein